MSVEWFDLGQRLKAAHTGHPTPRLLHAPITTVPKPVAVRTHNTGNTTVITATAPGHPPATASGMAALDLLGTLGVTITEQEPATLITDDPATLPRIYRLALSADTDTDTDAVAAHIAWWRTRADYPGGRSAVDTIETCRTRWTLGTDPTAEEHPSTWRTWLRITDDSVAGLLDLHTMLSDGPPLTWLEDLSEDDEWSYGAAQTEFDHGLDWRRPDSTARAAYGLRTRCDAADLYAAALLMDPCWRQRATHTGHVVTGTANRLSNQRRNIEITCPRLDSRLRPGTTVTGWAGSPADNSAENAFHGNVVSASVRNGDLILTIGSVSGTTPTPTQAVTLTTTPPSPHRQRAGRKAYRTLYSARRSWLTTGRTPTPTRRPVPLDVIVAGADPDDMI